jgi:hypothetical protein
VVVDQDFNKMEVILKINNKKLIIISLNKDNEVAVEIGVVIVVIIEVVFVEMKEIDNNNNIKYKIQMLILHHRQIQIDVIEVLLMFLDNNKINGMLVIGMVKRLFIQEQLKMMNNHHIQMIHLEVLTHLFFLLFF